MRRLIFSTAIASSILLGLIQPVHAAGGVPPGPQAVLIHETHDFGYWMTYSSRAVHGPASQRVTPQLIDANIEKHLGGQLAAGQVATVAVPRLLTRMHLTTFPTRYTFTILSYSNQRAVERIHWQMSGGHGPQVRLVWTSSVIGWSISDVSYLRMR